MVPVRLEEVVRGAVRLRVDDVVTVTVDVCSLDEVDDKVSVEVILLAVVPVGLKDCEAL